jgi:aromatic ring-cleaving dioxygenase
MGIKTYRVFFAIPFDSATREMYERVGAKIRTKFGVNTTIGTKEIGPSPQYSDIASFKAQNTEMISQMRLEIEHADIVIADMTHNNPNVHFELGISLYLNKNILRVTGRSLTELGFDVRGLEVSLYKNEESLLQTITKYVELFLQIKDLPLTPCAGPLYRCETVDGKTLKANQPNTIVLEPISGFLMRDGAVRASFNFSGYQSKEDWFGFYVRFDVNPFLSSYLVYVRQNGSVEIAVYPGPRRIANKLLVPEGINGEKTLLVELDGDTAKATLDGSNLIYDRLEVQTQGKIGIAAWQSEVFYRNVEVVCRDTINS